MQQTPSIMNPKLCFNSELKRYLEKEYENRINHIVCMHKTL